MRTLKNNWIVITVVAVVVFLLLDVTLGRRIISPAVVAGKSYAPSQTHIGSGVAVGSDGQTHVVTSTSTDSEKYVLIVDCNGEIFSAETSPETWVSATNGSRVAVIELVGRWTGIQYSQRAE